MKAALTKKQTAAIGVVGVVAAAAFATAAWRAFVTAGQGTMGSGPVDALIVFGSPTDITGALLPMQSWRVHEAAAEYARGVAPHIIFTGGPAANKYVEADTMAAAAEASGVPSSAILKEQQSHTTVENLQGVAGIMQSHGWSTAELISSSEHLPRIAVLARSAPYRWRLHAAPTPGRGRLAVATEYGKEAAATLVLRTFGSAAEPVIHAVAVCWQWIAFLPKLILWKLQHKGPRLASQ